MQQVVWLTRELVKHAVKESDELYLWLLRQVVGKMEGLSLHLSLFMWDLLSCLLFWGKKTHAIWHCHHHHHSFCYFVFCVIDLFYLFHSLRWNE